MQIDAITEEGHLLECKTAWQPGRYICRDFGRPLCCSIPDPRYTMRFDNIGEEPIYWCTFCGKQAAEMDALIRKALKDDPSFVEKFKKEIDKY